LCRKELDAGGRLGDSGGAGTERADAQAGTDPEGRIEGVSRRPEVEPQRGGLMQEPERDHRRDPAIGLGCPGSGPEPTEPDDRREDGPEAHDLGGDADDRDPVVVGPSADGSALDSPEETGHDDGNGATRPATMKYVESGGTFHQAG